MTKLPIFGLRGRSARQVRDLVAEHLNWVEAALLAGTKAVEEYLGGKPHEELEEMAIEVHRKESRADDARKAAEVALVRGALLVGTRQNLLAIIDQLDKVANAAEAAVDFLVYQRVAVPGILSELIQEVLRSLKEEWAELREGVQAFLASDAEKALEKAEQVDRLESHLDDLHRRLILRLFSTDLPLAEKIQARDFLDYLESCANAGEDAADLLTISLAVSRMD